MNCDDLVRRLVEFSEGTLDEAVCVEIRLHLRDCDPCSELQRDLETLARLCQCDPTPRMPDALRARLVARLRDDEAEE
jgi:hypothetical protein